MTDSTDFNKQSSLELNAEQQISSLRKQLEIALTQEELDRLFFRDTTNTTPKTEEDAIKNQKIAKRNQHSKEVLDQANKNIRNYVAVVDSFATLSYKELKDLTVGDSIALTNESASESDILVNGKLFGRGIIETTNGTKSIKLTWLAN